MQKRVNNKRNTSNVIQSKGKRSPEIRTICCLQVITTTNFKNNQMNIIYKGIYNVNYNGKFITFLFEHQKCDIQFVGKGGTNFNIRLLSNHH